MLGLMGMVVALRQVLLLGSYLLRRLAGPTLPSELKYKEDASFPLFCSTGFQTVKSLTH
jgi:hypothetical protein